MTTMMMMMTMMMMTMMMMTQLGFNDSHSVLRKGVCVQPDPLIKRHTTLANGRANGCCSRSTLAHGLKAAALAAPLRNQPQAPRIAVDVYEDCGCLCWVQQCRSSRPSPRAVPV
eukprot:2986879-Rhodomonas_salina.1